MIMFEGLQYLYNVFISTLNLVNIGHSLWLNVTPYKDAGLSFIELEHRIFTESIISVQLPIPFSE